jgi:hypothetical protein
MEKTFFYFLLCCLAFTQGETAFAQFSITDFKPLHTLAGTWKMKTKNGFLFEHWYGVNDSTLQNKSYRVNGTDTIPEETVLLKISNGAIIYISTVANQNNQQPVSFTLIKKENGKYIFENKGHDFPQQISYHLKDDNHLDASISGTVNDKFREIRFNFKREEKFSP